MFTSMCCQKCRQRLRLTTISREQLWNFSTNLLTNLLTDFLIKFLANLPANFGRL